MSFASDDAFKERIKEATDIVDLVQQYRPLSRSGRNYVALCPWHDDSRPSLQVNPERQTYTCWVCNERGDVFSFIMKMENVGFREAMEILAERAGIPLPKKKEKKFFLKPTGQNPPKQNGTDDPNAALAEAASEYDEHGYSEQNHETVQPQPQEVDKKTLLKAVEWLAQHYHQALLTLDEAEVARKYLRDRKISDESIRKFQIGYAPNERDWLVRKVKSEKQLQILELVGNLRPSKNQDSDQQNAGYYDFFRGRVMFPIRDDQGRTVGFGGRVIPGTPLAQKDVGKYMNTPETPLYLKHKILFGFDFAKHKMRSTKRALIMEGYTDVISAHQFGFEDAVAACGTAVGPEHIRKLKSHVDKILLVLDGDKAGTASAARVLGDFVAEGADMAVVTLPSGLDPAEFLEQHGAEAFKTYLNTEAVDALEHAFRVKTQGIDLDHDVIASSNALDELLTVIAKTPMSERKFDDPLRIRVEKTLQNLSHRFGVPEETIRRRFNDKRRREKEYAARRYDDSGTEYPEESQNEGVWSSAENLPDLLEREMIELWLVDPTTLYEFWEPVPPERCRSPITREIYLKCNEIVDRSKTATFDRLLVAFAEEPRMKGFLIELDESARRKLAVHTPPVVAEEVGEESPTVRDEVGELEESLRSRDNEIKLPPEKREKLIREILDGFDRRDRDRRNIKEVDQLRGDSLTEEEKLQQLLQMQAQQKRLQEEKKRKLGLGE